MIKGVRDFCYSVHEPKKAIRFYTEALGMNLLEATEHWIAFECGGVVIGLYPEEQPIPRVPRDSYGALTGGTLTLVSDNIPVDRERLEKYGGKVLGESKQPWGHMLVFEDPDGNVLKLMEPKEH